MPTVRKIPSIRSFRIFHLRIHSALRGNRIHQVPVSGVATLPINCLIVQTEDGGYPAAILVHCEHGHQRVEHRDPVLRDREKHAGSLLEAEAILTIIAIGIGIIALNATVDPKKRFYKIHVNGNQ